MFSLLVLAILLTTSVTGVPYRDCKKDAIIERSCHQIVGCKNNRSFTTTCDDKEVINFQSLKCEAVDKAPPPCGQVVDCSKKPDGKYAETRQKCATYYTCLAHQFVGHNVCPPGLVFSNVNEACDFPFNVAPPCGIKTSK